MAEVWTVAQGKGGVGKSTSAAELAAHLGQHHGRTLAVDCDRQGNLGTWLGWTPDHDLPGEAAEVLTRQMDATDAAVPAPAVENVDLLIGTQQMAGLSDAPQLMRVVISYVRSLKAWDHVVIDTPSHIGVPTLAAITGAHHLIVPVNCAAEALVELDEMQSLVTNQIVGLGNNPDAKIDHVIPTMVDQRRRMDRETIELLNEDWAAEMTAPIRQATAVKEAFTAGMPVSAFDPTAPVAQDYAAVMKHITA